MVRCSGALNTNADFGKLTVKQGTPVNFKHEKHARLDDWKRSSWMLWIELSGEPFTQAMFTRLLKLV